MNVGNSFANIPAELRQLKQWVVWRLEDIPNSNKKTKRPYQINGQLASVTEPSHWMIFDEAVKLLDKYSGLGFVFTDSEYSGIDLDDASFLIDGSPNPNYQSDLNRQIKIAHEFDSYSEVSPSGKGLHIIVKGKVPDGKRRNYIELYPSGRFFTMTGVIHNNKEIKDCQELLTLLWSQMGGNVNPTSSVDSSAETSTDEEVLNLARKHNASTFADLEAGVWVGKYPSQSEADQSYLNIISYYTNSKSQVERIFRQSKLMRAKVNTNKPYLARSINKAFDLKVPLINFDNLKDQLELKLNGAVAQRLEPIVISSNPASPTTPPGLLGEIASFIYAAAPRPVPEVALAASIGLLSGITGRAYNISGTGLNQYVLLLAMTGAGKEAAASGINKLMSTIRMQVPSSIHFIGPSEISSGSALFKYLGNQSQSFISLLGEFGLRLQQMSSPNANGSEVSLRRMFLDLYNKSGYSEILHASVYSDKANNTSAVPSPSFSILGESTPERFYGALNEDMISEGLLPRFLLIEYKGNRPDLNEHHTAVVPNFSLIERLAALAAHCDSINHSNPRRIINVQSTSEAAKSLRDFDLFATNKINHSNKEVIRQLWNRAHIKVLKLSALLAVGQNMLEPIISQIDFEWSVNLVKSDIQALTERFEAGEIGSNSFEVKQAGEIIRIIKDYIYSTFDKVEKYSSFPTLHADKLIPYVYIQRRLVAASAFRNDKSGATFAIKRAIQNLVDADRLNEASKQFMMDKHKTYQRCFAVKDLRILD